MIIILMVICATATIAAYIILRVSEWLERKTNKKFPVGEVKEVK